MAVVGGGIAGVGAAWSLHRAGFPVSLFEARATLGGNAKTHLWDVEGEPIITGLSVLAWPRELFRNYRCLIDELGVETEPIDVRYTIARDGDSFVQGRDSVLGQRYAGDLARWRRLANFVARVNRVFARTDEASLYHAPLANPLNFVSLRRLSRMFGVSRDFWETIVVSFYTAAVLSARMDTVPAVVLPTLDAILSIDKGARLDTWTGSSRDVFDRMTAGFVERVYLDTAIERIWLADDGVALTDERGKTHRFDRVVLASNAKHLARAIENPTRRQTRCLSRIAYTDDDDSSFLTGHIHSDPTALPTDLRDEILERYSNHVDVLEAADGSLRYENHFVLSPWVPAARGCERPMLIWYNKPADHPLEALGEVSNETAHPSLSLANLARIRGIRRFQGERCAWYCGSYVTPANGHDLSLVSGLVAAEALGAGYPFEKDAAARRDFERLRALILPRALRPGGRGVSRDRG